MAHGPIGSSSPMRLSPVIVPAGGMPVRARAWLAETEKTSGKRPSKASAIARPPGIGILLVWILRDWWALAPSHWLLQLTLQTENDQNH